MKTMDFINHLKTYLSEEEIALLMEALKEDNKHALILNTDKMSVDTLLTLYPSLKRHPIVDNAFIYDKNELDLGKSIYHELGCFYLQEPSAMIPAYLLSPKEDEIVLDLCAAPGGKSMQASFLMNNKGLIIANDISKNRAYAISNNAERLGRGNLLITNNDFSLIYRQFNNYFDKIILDAPCSGSGMFRKEDKMWQDWTYQKVIRCQEMQKQLISIAYQMLKPGGTLLYSTCSFSYEEDEEVVDYLLNNSDATIGKIPASKYYYQSKNNGHGIHLLPFLFPGEGHYIALINKPGEKKISNLKKDNNKTITTFTNGYTNEVKFGDFLYLNSYSFPLKNLNVIRYGVKVGQIDKGEIRYDFHYAHFINNFDKIVDISLEKAKKYYQGESLPVSIEKGYVLLRYQNINIDIAKSDGRIIKNRLPKGLRKKFVD